MDTWLAVGVLPIMFSFIFLANTEQLFSIVISVYNI